MVKEEKTKPAVAKSFGEAKKTKEVKVKTIVKKEVKKVEKTVKKPVEKAPASVKATASVKTTAVKAGEAKEPKKLVFYQAVGRRKTATATVRLTVNPQNKEKFFTVNGRPVEKYFSLSQQKKAYVEPLRTTNTLNRFDITVKVEGSGSTGQLDAMIHGLSRALSKVDPERFSKILRKRGFMTRDPRAKERKKVGIIGARHVKQSPRR